MSKKLILVEGAGDKAFIRGILNKMQIHDVEIAPPQELPADAAGKKIGNGVSNVIKYISVLVTQIKSWEVSAAAIVVDADYPESDGGFLSRRTEISDKLALAGYVIPPYLPDKNQTGEIFLHPAGYAPIGLFLTPNHHDDGMLEDLLKTMITKSEQVELLEYAQLVLPALPHTLFNPNIHLAKAEIASLLAWQDSPPALVSKAVKTDIFDSNATACVSLKNWLNQIFPAS